MTTAILEAPAIDPGSLEPSPRSLATCSEKLAALRFMIILTARWENSDSLGKKRRRQMRLDLEQLRKLYSDTIDAIAMSFSVQQAMDTQREVERGVSVPRGLKLPEPIAAGVLDDEGSRC